MWTTLFYKNPRLTLLVVTLIMITGTLSYMSIGRQEDPILERRFATVEAYWPGADAQRVEALVTKPMEDAVREVPEIKEFSSESGAGFVILSLELEESVSDVDIYWSKVRTELEAAALSFPNGVTSPELTERSATAVTLVAGLLWTRQDEPQLDIMSRLAEDLADKLRNVDGTREVLLYGEAQEEVQVTLDATRLGAAGLSVADVATAIRNTDSKIPAGQLRAGRNDLLIEVAGELKQLDQIRNIPITRLSDGRILRVRDVGDVHRGALDPPRSLALHGDARSVFVSAEMEENGRINVWAKSAKAVLADFAKTVPPGLELKLVFDQETYTNERLNGLINNLIMGVLVVIAVLLFTMGLKPALLVAASLPLTIAVVIIFYNFSGMPLMQTSMVGIIVALGLLIDNAIVVVDDYSALRRDGAGVADAIHKAISHLSVPLFASTATTALAFAPIILMGGGGGEFVGPLAIGVVVAILSSFFLAMTVIPAITGYVTGYMASTQAGGRVWWRDGFHNDGMAHWYRSTLKTIIKRPIIGIAVSLLIPAMGFYFSGQLEQQFFPANDRDMMQVEVQLPSSASMEETRSIVSDIRAVLQADPAVKETYWVIGASAPRVYYTLSSKPTGVASFAQGIIVTQSASTTLNESERIQRMLMAQFPQARIMAMPFEQGPPANAPLELRIVGPDIDTLRQLGDDVRLILQDVPEVTFARAQLTGGSPKLRLNIDADMADLAGLTPSDIARNLNTTLEGAVGGSIVEGSEELPVRVQVDRDVRSNLAEIQSHYTLPANPNRRPNQDVSPGIPLSAVSPSMELMPTTTRIPHYMGERVNTIQAFVLPFKLPATALGKFYQAMEEANYELPQGYRFIVGGESEQSGEAVGDLMTFAVPIFVLMLGIIILSFNSFIHASIVFIVAFLSVGLALFGVWLFDNPFGFVAIVGTMGLVGIAINGTIVVLSALRASEAAMAGNAEEIENVVYRATRHILSTTLTTIGGFAPLIIFGGRFWQPLATAIAGGVAGSAILALYLTPALFVLIARFATRKNQGVRRLSESKALADRQLSVPNRISAT